MKRLLNRSVNMKIELTDSSPVDPQHLDRSSILSREEISFFLRCDHVQLVGGLRGGIDHSHVTAARTSYLGIF